MASLLVRIASTRVGACVLAVAMAVCVLGALEMAIHTTAPQYSVVSMGAEPPVGMPLGDNIGGQAYAAVSPVEPIDVVYTWVNGSDPQLLDALARVKEQLGIGVDGNETDTAPVDAAADTPLAGNGTCVEGATGNGTCGNATQAAEAEVAVAPNRYRDSNELLFSLRSLEAHAPWVRRVYIVTNGQVPSWLDTSNPRVQIVTHDKIFPNRTHLPTFSSPAIEAHLHRIPGLSKRFLYLNDDVFFGSPVTPDDFFTHARGHKVYLSWAVPPCAPGCDDGFIRDGFCDGSCNVAECDFDGGDCEGFDYDDAYAYFSNDSQYCAPQCKFKYIGEHTCQPECMVNECAFDGGDCGTEIMQSSMVGFALTLDDVHAPDEEPVTLMIPEGTPSIYVNVSGVFGGGVITAAQQETVGDAEVVPDEGAMVSLKHMLMTVLFEPDVSSEMVMCNMTGKLANGTEVTVSFNLFVEGPAAAPEDVIQRDTDAGFYDMDGLLDELQRRDEDTAQAAVAHTHDPVVDDGGDGSGDSDDLLSAVLGSVGVDDFGLPLDLSDAPGSLGAAVAALNNDDDDSATLDVMLSDLSEAPMPEGLMQNPFIDLDEAMDIDRMLSTDYELKEEAGLTDRKEHKLDLFASSLRRVQRLLNQRYGYESRKVIAHMPFLIDRDVVQRMQDVWPAEFAETSAARVRTPRDMQFAFSYYYFLMSEEAELDLASVFARADMNHDGELDDNDLDVLDRMAFQGFLMDDPLADVVRREVSILTGEPWTNASRVDLATLAQCRMSVEVLVNTTRRSPMYPYQIMGTDSVAFKMLRDNATQVREWLNGIRAKSQKFVCLNDDMDDGHDEVLAMLNQFYLSFFPTPSQFERADSGAPVASVAVFDERMLVHGAALSVALFVFLVLACGGAGQRAEREEKKRKTQ